MNDELKIGERLRFLVDTDGKRCKGEIVTVSRFSDDSKDPFHVYVKTEGGDHETRHGNCLIHGGYAERLPTSQASASPVERVPAVGDVWTSDRECPPFEWLLVRHVQGTVWYTKARDFGSTDEGEWFSVNGLNIFGTSEKMRFLRSVHGDEGGEGRAGRFPPQAGDVWQTPYNGVVTFTGRSCKRFTDAHECVTANGITTSFYSGAFPQNGGKLRFVRYGTTPAPSTDGVGPTAQRARETLTAWRTGPQRPAIDAPCDPVPMSCPACGSLGLPCKCPSLDAVVQAALVARTDEAVRKLRLKYGAVECPKCHEVFDKVGRSGLCTGCYWKAPRGDDHDFVVRGFLRATPVPAPAPAVVCRVDAFEVPNRDVK